jgi:hypothetical protein
VKLDPLPLEHAQWLTELGITLAVIDSNRPDDLTPEQYWPRAPIRQSGTRLMVEVPPRRSPPPQLSLVI